MRNQERGRNLNGRRKRWKERGWNEGISGDGNENGSGNGETRGKTGTVSRIERGRGRIELWNPSHQNITKVRDQTLSIHMRRHLLVRTVTSIISHPGENAVVQGLPPGSEDPKQHPVMYIPEVVFVFFKSNGGLLFSAVSSTYSTLIGLLCMAATGGH